MAWIVFECSERKIVAQIREYLFMCQRSGFSSGANSRRQAQYGKPSSVSFSALAEIVKPAAVPQGVLEPVPTRICATGFCQERRKFVQFHKQNMGCSSLINQECISGVRSLSSHQPVVGPTQKSTFVLWYLDTIWKRPFERECKYCWHQHATFNPIKGVHVEIVTPRVFLWFWSAAQCATKTQTAEKEPWTQNRKIPPNSMFST